MGRRRPVDRRDEVRAADAEEGAAVGGLEAVAASDEPLDGVSIRVHQGHLLDTGAEVEAELVAALVVG